jgi:malate/lactate dehydrogenase
MKITIIGAAGTLGSCAVYTLISKHLADEILMIDPFKNGLKGHWRNSVIDYYAKLIPLQYNRTNVLI